MKIPKGFEKAGTISVDSGVVLIGDPCYWLKGNDETLDEFWARADDGASDSPDGASVMRFPNGAEGQGVVVPSGLGDGRYGVYTLTGADGVNKAVMVVFEEEA